VAIALQKKYSDRLNFDVISGGMITGTRVGPLSNMASFISGAYKTVEQHTGIRFGSGFLDKTLKEGKATFSSLEPSKVLTVFKQFQPGNAVEFSHQIQRKIYGEGIDPIQYSAYLPLFEQYGLDPKKVLPLFASKELEQQTISEFALAQKWNVSGFPACILQNQEGKAFGISSGYLPFPEMEKKIQPYL
jgi:putative protein-disulfide isomerase